MSFILNSLFALLLLSAPVNEGTSRINSTSSNVQFPDWKEQLKKIINTPDSLLIKSDIKLVSYKEKQLLSDDRSVIEFERQLLDENNILPITRNDRIELVPIKDIYKIYKQSDMEYLHPEVIRLSLLDLLAIHMQVVELEWSYQGKTIESLCVVDRARGIVYDHVISNIFIPEIKLTRTKPIDSSSQKQDGPVYITETVTGTVKNLSGTPLGIVTLEHQARGVRKQGVVSIITSTRSYNIQSGYPGVSIYAEYRQTNKDLDEKNISEMTYAGYFTTGGTQLSITWDGDTPIIQGGASSFNLAQTFKGISKITTSDPDWNLQN